MCIRDRGYAGLVDQCEAEAALACGLDTAIERREGVGQGADGFLDLVLSIHFSGCSLKHVRIDARCIAP